MRKTGLADSPFFTLPPKNQTKLKLANKPPEKKTKDTITVKEPTEKLNKNKKPSNHDTMTPRHHETTDSRYQDTIVEVVRKAAK